MEEVVPLFDQLYVNGAVPPPTDAEAVPLPVQVAGVDESVAVRIAGSVIVTAVTIGHPLLSVTFRLKGPPAHNPEIL